jgi:regulation of enolase protein 1 (concanavalin A-like superfamily)
MDLLQDISTGGLGALNWTHEPSHWDPLPGGGVRVFAPEKVDYFQDPRGRGSRDSAPFLWVMAEGDFVAQLHVQPTFRSTYDAGCLMVRHSAQLWAKLCFENTDLGTHAIVSVVTDGLSDDANGVDLDVPNVWLQIARQGEVLAMHYALDGVQWRMVRLFALPLPPRVQVGLVAQSPSGPGTTVDFFQFALERSGPKDLRSGV